MKAKHHIDISFGLRSSMRELSPPWRDFSHAPKTWLRSQFAYQEPVACTAFAVVNAALIMGLPYVSPTSIFNLACDLDEIDDDLNRRAGTLVQASAEAYCRTIAERGIEVRWCHVPQEELLRWCRVQMTAAVAVAPWHLNTVGLIPGDVRRYQPAPFSPGHAVCVTGWQARKRIGLFTKGEAVEFIDSGRNRAERLSYARTPDFAAKFHTAVGLIPL